MVEPQESCMQITLNEGQIRLLHIEAGDGPQIKCHASITELSSAEPYAALSYTWGTYIDMENILIDNNLFPVTQNLYAALLQLRSKESNRVIWIDAVCINQTHHEERTVSVRLMKNIYTRASEVVIWLGVETDGDRDAFALFEAFEKSFERHGFFHVTNGIAEYKEKALPSVGQKEWEAAARLFQRPYFSRIWIVQEVVVSSQAVVHCGPLTVKWESLLSFVRSISVHGMIGHYQIEHSARGALSVAMMGNLKQSESIPLLDVLVATRHYKSTDPRDRIYALLGIATNADHIGVRVDYALSTEEVFTMLAIHAITAEKSIAVLGSVGQCGNFDSGAQIPTWVPDWTHDNDRRICLSVTGAFKAAGNSVPVISLSEDRKVLNLRGIEIDTVSVVTKTTRKYTNTENPNETEEMFGTVAESPARIRFEKKLTLESEHLAEGCWNYPEGQSREEAYWRTVACDMTTDHRRLRDNHVAGYRYWNAFMSACDMDGNFDVAKYARDLQPINAEFGGFLIEIEEWTHAATIHSVARNVCVTTGGRIGLVSCETLPGDIVCVFLGGSVPFVLRPVSDGYFKLVGECYMHGVMDGEAFSKESIYKHFSLI